jgi:hypothetical protein
VAVLKGDAVCNDMVAVSIYDTKPVYMLSMACDKVGWVKKEKKVYDSEKKVVKMPFYWLNLIDFYNHNMGNVDMADQLWNHYRYDSNCPRKGINTCGDKLYLCRLFSLTSRVPSSQWLINAPMSNFIPSFPLNDAVKVMVR